MLQVDRIFRSLSLAAVLVLASADFAQSDSLFDIEDADVEPVQLESLPRLEHARLFQALERAQITLDDPSRCGQYLGKARETRDLLAQLKTQFADQTDAAYLSVAGKLQAANGQAIEDYKSCYATGLKRFDDLQAAGIVSYEIHTRYYNDMVDAYAEIDDLDAYVARLEAGGEKPRGNGQNAAASPAAEFPGKKVNFKGFNFVLPEGLKKTLRSGVYRYKKGYLADSVFASAHKGNWLSVIIKTYSEAAPPSKELLLKYVRKGWNYKYMGVSESDVVNVDHAYGVKNNTVRGYPGGVFEYRSGKGEGVIFVIYDTEAGKILQIHGFALDPRHFQFIRERTIKIVLSSSLEF